MKIIVSQSELVIFNKESSKFYQNLWFFYRESWFFNRNSRQSIETPWLLLRISRAWYDSHAVLLPVSVWLIATDHSSTGDLDRHTWSKFIVCQQKIVIFPIESYRFSMSNREIPDKKWCIVVNISRTYELLHCRTDCRKRRRASVLEQNTKHTQAQINNWISKSRALVNWIGSSFVVHVSLVGGQDHD